ncbi:MAG TPA: class I SAM-dependent methyltransferase [Actinophytocola sp.]|uniref:class I SAM-dependent methyltransferase n=1 Tax=Actinophytocola sp. TaxID=1872138 RepID=UPI002DFFA1F5|nr:class I SAM-dependent methyltransferase [Actinophytocola sp.]
MSTFVSLRAHQFAYFDPELGHPDWAGATVLDFGGNAGNILLDPHCTIRPENYWSVDISRDAISVGERRHPRAHFVWYDRYNFEFNPTGTPGLPIPDLGRRFDIILAYSVFDHTPRAEMLELVDQLRAMLTADGVLAFTFVDPNYDPPAGWIDEERGDEVPGADNLLWRLTLGLGAEEAARMAAGVPRRELTWVTLVNGVELVLGSGDDWVYTGHDQPRYFTFCTEEHMRVLYPDAEILPPVAPQRQSCCVVGRKELHGN